MNAEDDAVLHVRYTPQTGTWQVLGERRDGEAWITESGNLVWALSEAATKVAR